jgi:predicted outer membrane repeat protein
MANKKIVLAFLTFFAILLMLNGAVSAANVTVNPGDSIQSAIDNAYDNDTIIVNDNNGSAYTYTENVVINKAVSLKAKTGGNVTIRPLDSSSSIITVNSGVNVEISDLTFRDSNVGTDGTGGAIYNHGTLTVMDCNFINNTANWGGAICNDGTLTVTDSTFINNTATHDGGAINSVSVLTVNNSTFINNNAQNVAGAIINWQ